MDRVRAALRVLAAACLAAATAFPAAVAAAEPAWTTVPSSLCRGLFVVPVAFGEREGETLQMVLDTGATRTVVDPDAVERAFGRLVKKGRRTTLRGGAAGAFEIRKVRAFVSDLDHIAWALGRPVDGILGFGVFEDMLLTLDYGAGEVRVARGRLPPVDGVEVFEDVGRGRPFLLVGLGGTTVPVLVDSGSSGGLDLRPEDVPAWEVAPRPVTAAARFQEIVLEEAGRLAHDVAFGPAVLERPIVSLRDGTRLAGARVLERFTWTFDEARRRIRIVFEGDAPIETPPQRGAGLALKPVAEGFEVLRVLAGTSAEHAGLREGDLVVARDGVPIQDRGCHRVDGSDGAAETIVLTIERDGERRDVELQIGVLVP